MGAVEVVDNPELERFQAREDGEVLGFLEYERDGKVLALIHTEVDSRHRGKGVADSLMLAAVAELRVRNERAVPLCPYARAWFKKHPEFAGLTADLA